MGKRQQAQLKRLSPFQTNDCRAASWVPGRLAQGWKPFQHLVWLMQSILWGGFLQGSIHHLFFEISNVLTTKLTLVSERRPNSRGEE